MRILSALRASMIALVSVAGTAFMSAAHADSGGISFSVIKAGLVIGGSAGSGTLTFHGKRYPVGIGGISYGFTFGASETRFHGTVTNIRSAADVSGVYAAGNPANKPAGSGWWAADLNQGQCAVKSEGLFGCTFNKDGVNMACGLADIDNRTHDLLVIEKTTSR